MVTESSRIVEICRKIMSNVGTVFTLHALHVYLVYIVRYLPSFIF